MAGYVIGIGFILFAVWRLLRNRMPPDGIKFSGTIVEELSRESMQVGRRRPMYAPRVAFQHPRTGAAETFEPTRFNNDRFTVGASTALVYDPATDTVTRPLDRPVKDTIVLVLLGVGLMAAQFLAN
jgi:hypothetical protein